MRLASTTRTIALATVTLALSAAPAAAETEIFFDDFESYADQAALEAAWAPFFNTTLEANHPSVLLSTEQAASGTKSAKEFGVTTAQGTAASPRNTIFFPDSDFPSADNLVHFEFNFYDATGTGNPQRHYSSILNSGAPSSSGGLVQMGLNNNLAATAGGGNFYMGRVFGYNPADDEPGGPNANGAFFKLNGFGTGADPATIPLRSAGWHKLGVTISDTDFKFYVDDILARVVDRAVGNAGTPVTVRSFDEIRVGPGVSNNNTVAYYDDFRVVLNPEPPAPPEGPNFNNDGFVNGQDFLIWQRNTGATGQIGNGAGDANGDGNVNILDFNAWKAEFGNPAATAASSQVPEPASAVLALAAIATLARTHRRQRS